MAHTFDIDGVTKTIQTGWRCHQVANGLHNFQGEFYSSDGSFVPTVGDSFEWDEHGTLVFGGIVDRVETMGKRGEAISAIVSRVVAKSYGVYADRRFATETFTAGSTLKSALTTLVNNYLTDYGVTLHASQANGPNLTADFVFSGVKISEILNQLSTDTGYIWEITAAKELRAFDPGSEAAPFNITSAGKLYDHDISINRIREKYANRVIVKFGPAGNVAWTDNFTGDGSTDTFALTYPIALGAVHPYSWAGYVTNAGTNETLDVAGQGATWEYDPAAQTIERVSGAPANLAAISINYDVTFPQTVTAEDATEITNNGPVELVLSYPNITQQAQAQAIADALLAQYLGIVEIVSFTTKEVGILPGQSLSIVVSERGINGTYMVTEVEIAGEVPQYPTRRVRAIGGTAFRGSFRNLYLDWLGGGKSGSVSSTVQPTVGSGFGAATTPGGANRQVQFNDSGAFGGSAGALIDKNGSGTTWGVEALRARLAVGVPDDGDAALQLAIFNEAAGAAKALTFWQLDDGTVFCELDGGGDLVFANYGSGGQAQLAAVGQVLIDADAAAAVRIKDRVGVDSLYGAGRRKTGAYTLDADLAGGSYADAVVVFSLGSGATFTLPALSSISAAVNSTIHGRFVWIINDGSANDVTVDANGSETIGNGSGAATTLTVAPGEAYLLYAWTGTGAGWKILGKYP